MKRCGFLEKREEETVGSSFSIQQQGKRIEGELGSYFACCCGFLLTIFMLQINYFLLLLAVPTVAQPIPFDRAYLFFTSLPRHCLWLLLSKLSATYNILLQGKKGMSKQSDEDRFNKAVEIYIKKYQLTIYSLIKFIEEKIALTPDIKNVVISEILDTKSREAPINKEELKQYLHMVSAAQHKLDVRGRAISSFREYFKLTFKESKPKDEKSAADEQKKETKPEGKVQAKKEKEVKQPQVKQEAKAKKEQVGKAEQPVSKPAPELKEIPQKKKDSKGQTHFSPKKELQIIEQDVIDQNRVSNASYKPSNTQELLLKLPEVQMMDLKSKKSVQITGYDKFGQYFLKPIIKFHIVFEEKSVDRRYSQFERLMNDLGRRYEGFILPELPPKEGLQSNLSYFRGVDEQFLNDRQIKLQEMLNCLVNSKFVSKDEILQKFLTNQDFEIEKSSEGGVISSIKSISSIALNTRLLKIYGIAYYNYLKQFNKSQINTSVTAKYKQVEELLNFCLAIDNYRNAVNANFEHRRDIFKELKLDKNDRNLTITKFDTLSNCSAAEIKNLSKEVDKYLELKSQESWLNYLIREKEGEDNVEELKKDKEEIVSRIGTMEGNLITSIDQLKVEKMEYLQSVGDKMMEWRKSIHP